MRKSTKETVTLHLGPFHGEKLLMTRSLGSTLPFTVKNWHGYYTMSGKWVVTHSPLPLKGFVSFDQPLNLG